MTIGFDASRAFVKEPTGTENYSYQLLKHLSYIDTKNDYLIYLRSSVIPAIELESSRTLGPGSRIRPLEGPLDSLQHGMTGKSGVTKEGWPKNFKFIKIRIPRLWTQVGLAFRTFLDPVDVLLVPSHTLPLIRRPGLKTVITVHDLGSEYLPRFHQLKQVLYLKLMTHYQLRTASKIIAVSEATKKDLMKKIGIKSEKIEVIYEGVDRKVFKQMPKDIVNNIVKKFDLERGKYFLFVGTIQPRKNLERLIIAFSKFLSKVNSANKQVLGSKYQVLREKKDSLPHFLAFKRAPLNTSPLIHNTDFQLVLVGNRGWKSDSIYRLPKELGIEDKVLFTGRISDQELAGLYNGAAALTYPSLFEGFGLPIIEAFACGCPVITSNISSMPEVAGKAAILVNPENEAEITKAMLEIRKNDTLRDSMSQKGILRLDLFDWKKTAKDTIDILERTVTK